MAEEFHPLPIKHFPKLETRKENKDQKHWKNFEFPTIIKEFSAINYIDVSPVAPYNFLVTSNAKAQIIAPYTQEIKITSQRVKENVFGGRYRSDGKLMAIGGLEGTIQVLSLSSRNVLRNLKGHTRASKVCSFSNENTKLFSAADDKTVRYWDIPTGKELNTLKGHQDHIRCGCPISTVNEQFITGCYDHTVKIWDFRSCDHVLSFDHGAPVECVLMHRNGMICYSAGSNYIKVWDVVAGGRLLKQFSSQQKTVTTMCFNGDYTRLLSGSLDRHVKVHDVADDYNTVAALKYSSPILAMGLSRDDNHLVVGMSDGSISIRNRRKPKNLSENKKPKKRVAIIGGHVHVMPDKNIEPSKDDLIVKSSTVRDPNESEIDTYLRKYEHRAGFDMALHKWLHTPPKFVSLVTELARRNCWGEVLNNRDEKNLKPLMKFLMRNVGHPQYGKTLIPFADYVIGMYSPLLGSSKTFFGHIKQLNNKIKNDLINHEEMIKSLGALEQIFSIATPRTELQTLGELDTSVSSEQVEDDVIIEDTETSDLDNVTLLPGYNDVTAISSIVNGDNVEITKRTKYIGVDFNIDESNTKILITSD